MDDHRRRVGVPLFVRQWWFQVTLPAVIGLGAASSAFLGQETVAGVRDGLVSMTPLATVVFVLVFTVPMTLLGRSVFGLNDRAYEHVRQIRDIVSDFEDKVLPRGGAAVRDIYDKHIRQLRGLSFRTAIANNMPEWSEGVDESVSCIDDEELFHEITTRYLLPLEDEVNLLGFVIIRKVVSVTYMKLFVGAFATLVTAVLVLGMIHVVPDTLAWNATGAGLLGGVLTFALIYLAYAVSFVCQEVEEEMWREVEG